MSMMGADSRPEYYRQSAGTVLEALHSHRMGLTNAEAERRHHDEGANILPNPQTPSPLIGWIRAAVHPHILGLLIAAVLACAAEQSNLAIVAIVVGVVDNTIRFILRQRRASSDLPELASHSIVVRNGQNRRIESATLVIGDIIQLSAGDIVPADVRLLTVDDFAVDESRLLDTTKPAEKSTRSIRSDTPLSERSNLAWMGTKVTRGSAAAIVTGISAQTELGRIVLLARAVRSSATRSDWGYGWLLAGFVFVAAASVGSLAGADSRTLSLGLTTLTLALLPLALEPMWLIGLWRMRPGARIDLAALGGLAHVDTLLTHQGSIARLKAFKLHILHVGQTGKTMPLSGVSDEQLAQELQHGSAVFGELTPEEEVRLVRAAQLAGYHVAVVMESLSDLPAQMQADSALTSSDNLASVLASAHAARTLMVQARRVVLDTLLVAVFLALLSVVGLWLQHLPLIITPTLVLALTLIIVPIISSGLQLQGRTHSLSEGIVQTSAIAALAYVTFLASFGLDSVDPTFIDPTHPVARGAMTAAFVVVILCLLVRLNFEHARLRLKVGYMASQLVVGLLLLGVAYLLPLQALLGTAAVSVGQWLVIFGAAGIFALLVMLQQHVRRHSRHAVIELHRATFGKASPLKLG